MYITENQSISESVLFLLSARSTLAEMVEDSGHENADVMINFLMNEASDYEIVSLLTTGALPNEKYNPMAEAYLFSLLKEQALRSSETITEMMGQASFNDFMGKVNSVYPTMSTNGPVLEFFAAQDPQIYGSVILAEQGAKHFYTALAKKQASTAAGGGKIHPQFDMSHAAKAMAPRGEPMGKEGITKTIAKFGQHGQKGGGGAEYKPVGKSASTKATMAGEERFPQEFPREPMPKEPSAIVRHGREAKASLQNLWADVKAHAERGAAEVAKFAKTTPGQIVGGAALAALLAYAAAKTYKRFFSKAAGACRGMSGGVKTDCMNKYRGRALMAQAADLQRGMASCAKSKNPAACKSAVGGKIERLKARASKLAG